MNRLLLTFYLLFLCTLGINAQKCLVMFGVNDEVTTNPVRNPIFSIVLNDSIPVKYSKLEQQHANTYRLEFDYRAGNYTIWVEADGYKDAFKEFSVTTRRNTMFGIGTIYLKKSRTKTLS